MSLMANPLEEKSGMAQTPVLQQSGNGGGGIGTPVGELVDRNQLEGLHISNVLEDGKTRRRSSVGDKVK
jgi:hypothetical protein